jgi:cobyrinic acid a,c-diamide synthase
MSILPRLAVGLIQREADLQAVLWALFDALEQDGVQTQTFLSRACFTPHDAAAAITGNTPRHLDSWLMSPELCRRMFLRATEGVEMAIVEGRFDMAAPGQSGGSLDTLCDWLDLPRLAVVDCSLLSDCQIPKRPPVDALLLDRIDSECDFYRWQTILESLWGIPVIGAMAEAAELRRQVARLPIGEKPTRELCAALGRQFRQTSSLQSLLRLATRRGIPDKWYQRQAIADCCDRRACQCKVRVAIAYDEAFHCYFPDALDMLELSGADVRIFSPLHDECLPAETDVVYLGCGHPQDHATELAKNLCMVTALNEHICAGRRVYAEGGGLAYLCQHIQLADGSLAPMVGALRAVARRNSVRMPPEPVEITLADESWLGPAGAKVRGYRNCNWQLEPTGCVKRLIVEPEHELDLIGRHRVIGSRIHLNFAVHPALLAGFLRPCPQALAWAVQRS